MTQVTSPIELGAVTLTAGKLRAVLLPGRGMLVASLRHRGAEVLRRIEDLEGSASAGRTAGIPLLHPWANRLAGMRYAAAGTDVLLDAASPLLHFDAQHLPMHGVPWSKLGWEVVEATRGRVVARLAWSAPDLLAVFPFPHCLELRVSLQDEELIFDMVVHAGLQGPVPVSFGFHPFLGVPGLPRAEWHLTLPSMRRLQLDERGIPTGAEEPFVGFAGPLGDLDLDDGFVLEGRGTVMSLSGAERRIVVELLEGFGYAQVFAPAGKELVALEPMTAPTNALASGRGLRLVMPGQSFRAAFRVRVGDDK